MDKKGELSKSPCWREQYQFLTEISPFRESACENTLVYFGKRFHERHRPARFLRVKGRVASDYQEIFE